MKVIPETIDDIVLKCQANFRTFGGGIVTNDQNPIAHAMKNSPAAFAAGVSVRDVVAFVISESKQLPVKPAKKARKA